MTQTYPFRPKRGSTLGSEKWYELFGVSYAGAFLNQRNVYMEARGSRPEAHLGAQHAAALTLTPKVGYFSVAPFFNYTEKWYNERTAQRFDAADSSVVIDKERGFFAVRYFDMGVFASTKFFGIWQPNVLGVRGIRHQVTPSISYTYAPDFSAPGWGYYGSYRNERGEEVTYNYYAQEVFGGAPGEKRQSLDLRIGNVLEMKTASSDTAAEMNKFQLINFDVSTGYNFARDSLRFNEVLMGFRTNVGQFLNIGGNAAFNLYQYAVDPKTGAGRRVDKFLVSEEGRLWDMTRFSISVGTRFSGEKSKTRSGPVQTVEDSIARVERRGYIGLYYQEEPDFSIPWNLDLMWNYSESRPSPGTIFRSSTVNGSVGFNLTEGWKFTASASYDLLTQVFAAPQIGIYRDLHCWEMNFTWVPTGFNQNYRFEIRLKAPMLQDLKVTKQQNVRSIY
jgi:hypothetical protein